MRTLTVSSLTRISLRDSHLFITTDEGTEDINLARAHRNFVSTHPDKVERYRCVGFRENLDGRKIMHILDDNEVNLIISAKSSVLDRMTGRDKKNDHHLFLEIQEMLHYDRWSLKET